MNFSVDILADSLHADLPTRLTTFELTYPRMVHAELMTHRKFSRNSSSSRAIPIEKMLRDVKTSPVIPIHWGANQKGMQAYEELGEAAQELCLELWLEARDHAVKTVMNLSALGLHKQVANRLLEPWMWITVIVTSDQDGLNNWFKLRAHEAAEPHIQKLAYMMKEMYENHVPTQLNQGDWHLPFVEPELMLSEAVTIDEKIQKSVARCCRGSYLQAHGNFTLEQDLELYKRGEALGHWSPFEHQAQCVADGGQLNGNFCKGWLQHRKLFLTESGKVRADC